MRARCRARWWRENQVWWGWLRALSWRCREEVPTQKLRLFCLVDCTRTWVLRAWNTVGSEKRNLVPECILQRPRGDGDFWNCSGLTGRIPKAGVGVGDAGQGQAPGWSGRVVTGRLAEGRERMSKFKTTLTSLGIEVTCVRENLENM